MKNLTEAASDRAEALETAFERALQRVCMPEILSLEDASRVLHCSIDTLRRIPVEELPAYRVGRSNLYLRDEIVRYVRSRRITKGYDKPSKNGVKIDVDALIQEVLDSGSVDAREPSLRRVK